MTGAILRVLSGVLPLAWWPGSTLFDPPKQALLLLAAALLLARRAGAVAASLSARGGGVPSRTALPWPRVAFLLLLVPLAQAVSLLGRWNGRGALALLVTAAWVVVVGETAALPPRRRRAVLGWAVGGGALAAGVALLQMAGVVPGAARSTGMPPGIATLGNQNYVTGLAAVLLFAALGLAATAPGRRGRAAWGLAAAVLLTVVAAGGATGPVVALLAGLAAGGGSWWWRRRARPGAAWRCLTGCWLAGVLLAAALVGPAAWRSAWRSPVAGPVPALWSRLAPGDSGRQRLELWQATGALLRAHPWRGIGAGRYPALWIGERVRQTRARGEAWPPHSPRAVRAHQEPLQWLAETGLAGGLLLLVVLVGLWRAWRRRWPGPSPETEPLPWWLGGLTAVAAHATVSFPLRLPATALAAGLLLAVTLPAPALAATEDWDAAPGAVWRHRPARWLAAILLLAAAVLAGRTGLRELAAQRDLSRGEHLYRRGDLAAAARRLERGTARALAPGPAWFRLAAVRRLAGDDAGALAALLRNREEEPLYTAFALRADIAIDRRRWGAAAAALDTLQALGPDASLRREIRYQRGRLAKARGDTAAARAAWRDLLRVAPGDPRAHLGLGYLDLLGGRRAAARRHYQAAATVLARRLDRARRRGDPLAVRRLAAELAVARRALASVESDGISD